MSKFILLIIATGLLGCAISHSVEVHGSGNDIKTIYGDGNLDLNYKSNTTTWLPNG